MTETMDRAVRAARPVGTGRAELDAAIELTDRALRLLQAARRQTRRGMRLGGPAGDELRGAVVAMAAQADADLYEARIVLDRLLRAAAMDGVHAPRPIIELPPGD